MTQKKVIIVGGGFAGIACARELLKTKGIHVTLIDKNNYNQFTPLLYQVATSALSKETVATCLRHYFQNFRAIDIKMAHVSSVDLETKTVHTEEGESYQGDYIVLAAGSSVNFFDTIGASAFSFPLYGLIDAERLRSRIIAVFEACDRNPSLIQEGTLTFAIVGAGPTGVEIAGALADMLASAFPKEFSDLTLKKASIFLIDHAPLPLTPFSEASRHYAASVLKERGVKLRTNLLVKEITDSFVLLSNGEKIATKTVIWAGGLTPSSIAKNSNLTLGRGGRVDVLKDLSYPGMPFLYVIGDLANIQGASGTFLPQLAAVAKQCGRFAGKNIALHAKQKKTESFVYKDKGIMAMLGRGAAIVEVGTQRRELKGLFAYLTWLAVHASLLETFFQKMQAFLDWAFNYFGRTPSLQILDRTDADLKPPSNKELP